MPPRGQVAVDGGAPAAATVEVGEEALSIAPESGPAVSLPFVDIADLFDDNYTLRLVDVGGRRYDLSMLGKAYGQVVSDLRERRNDALQRHLLLTGVKLTDTYPGKLFGGPEPIPVEIRLFEDSLVVVPERTQMWGLPYSFIEEVAWDEALYQTHVRADDGAVHVFGHLAKRSEEFRDELNRLLAGLAARTAQTLQQLMPGVDSGLVSRLSGVMRDGRVAQQRAVDAIDPGLWSRLEDAVVGTEDLRESYEHLKAMSPAGWMALGVKAVKAAPDEDDVEDQGAGGSASAVAPPGQPPPNPGLRDGSGPPSETSTSGHHLWFFAPVTLKGNAIAHEVTSESGHATYLYRAGGADEATVTAAMARLNRAILALNFRREPIYASDEEIRTGRFARYRVAVRSLDYLRFAREQFLGRAIHNASWAEQVDQAVAKA